MSVYWDEEGNPRQIPAQHRRTLADLIGRLLLPEPNEQEKERCPPAVDGKTNLSR
jgi:hypothetical protein